MMYGELVVNNKYDYQKAGIFKQWLCFGAVLRPAAEGLTACKNLGIQLQARGYNAKVNGDCVLLSLNAKFAALLRDLGICTVADGYRPTQAISGVEWAEHDGAGTLPCFRSLRQLLQSEWPRRFLMPSDGTMLGEGLVVASEADGKLFKWKHAGEELGKVPDKLEEAVRELRRLRNGSEIRTGLLPAGLLEDLLEVFDLLLRVATTKVGAAKSVEKIKPKAKPAKEELQDTEAIAVFESAHKKIDLLDVYF
jgi:hypothetical protein